MNLLICRLAIATEIYLLCALSEGQPSEADLSGAVLQCNANAVAQICRPTGIHLLAGQHAHIAKLPCCSCHRSHVQGRSRDGSSLRPIQLFFFCWICIFERQSLLTFDTIIPRAIALAAPSLAPFLRTRTRTRLEEGTLNS